MAREQQQIEAVKLKLEQRTTELAFLADGIPLDLPLKREKAGDTAYWPAFRKQPIYSTVMLPGNPDPPVRGLNITSANYPPVQGNQPAPPPAKPPVKVDPWPTDAMFAQAAKDAAAVQAAALEYAKKAAMSPAQPPSMIDSPYAARLSSDWPVLWPLPVPPNQTMPSPAEMQPQPRRRVENAGQPEPVTGRAMPRQAARSFAGEHASPSSLSEILRHGQEAEDGLWLPPFPIGRPTRFRNDLQARFLHHSPPTAAFDDPDDLSPPLDEPASQSSWRKQPLEDEQSLWSPYCSALAHAPLVEHCQWPARRPVHSNGEALSGMMRPDNIDHVDEAVSELVMADVGSW